jgi:predicted AAA+ superfamily ATPase
MQTCYQWHEILPYYGNTIKRLSKKRKGYFFDSGLACYLQHISSVEALASHPNFGALFETWVINQVKILSSIMSPPPQIYHWRTNGGAEVDILLELNNVFYPIEIKCKVNLSKHDARGIMVFRESYPELNIAKGLIIYAGEISYPINQYVMALSWKTFKCELA